MKKILALMLGLSLLCACGAEESVPAPAESSASEAAASAVVEVRENTTHIALLGDAVDIDGDGARAQGAVVTIEKAGEYTLSGKLTDGQIIVDTDKESDVTLYLAGIDVTCTNSSPIYIKKVNNLDLVLEDGTENFVTDGAEYVLAEGEDEPDAAIFSKGDLKIKGNGSLNVTGNYNMAIHGKDDVKVKGGNLVLTAVNDCLKGKDSVEIEGGTLDIASGGDGIQSNNDTELGYVIISGGDITLVSQEDGINAEGEVTISGGTISIDAQEDGVQAGTNLTVTGGTLNLDTQGDGFAADGDLNVTGGDINVLSGEGSANAPEHTEDFGFGGPGGFPGWNDTATTTTEEEEVSAKGLKAGGNLTISGGNITVDALDDALHCALTATLEDGANLTLSTGDDGIHSDDTLIINGGDLNILTCYEGLEAFFIQIHGGNTALVASDDGINAAGGTGGEMMPFGPMGGFGTVETVENATYYVQITGGVMNIDASGDGLDSNGALFLEGGEVYLSGPENSANGALDYTSTGSISGGSAMITGSAGMAMNFDQNSTQCVVMYYFGQNYEGGTAVAVKGTDGGEILSFVPQKTFSSVIVSFPEMTVGETYTLVVGEEELTFTPTATVSSLGNGGFGMGGFGGMPGFGGGRPR